LSIAEPALIKVYGKRQIDYERPLTATLDDGVWEKRKWQPHASWGSGSGSCCETRLIIKSSVAAVSCDRSTVVPMRECLLENMILRGSDRNPE
jgi:hypothetical protein